MKIVFTKILTQENKHFLGTGAYLFLSDGCLLTEDVHLQILVRHKRLTKLLTYASEILFKD